MRLGLDYELCPIDGVTQIDAGEVYDEVWFWVEKNIRKMVSGKGAKQVLAHYLGEVGDEGEGTGSTLSFIFTDSAGLCGMSCLASLHWVELSIAALASPLEELILKPAGWTWKTKHSIENTLSRGSKYPLIEVKGVLYCLSRTNEGETPSLFTDDGLPTIELSALGKSPEKKVSQLALSGQCDCPMCKKFKAGKPPIDLAALYKKADVTDSFKRLSKALRYPHRAKELYIYEQSLYELSPEIKMLTRLKKLSAWGNYISTLPAEIGSLLQLVELDLGTNRLKCLPPEIATLSSLERLRVHSNCLTELPDEIGKLSSLQELSLSSNRLTELPKSFAKLANLAKLEIDHNPWKAFPKALLELPRLSTLTIHNLPEIAKEIADFPFDDMAALTSLSGWNVDMDRIPPSLFECVLDTLVLKGTKATNLPQQLPKWSGMTSLALEDASLESLPEFILEATGLTWLNLSNNSMTEIPDEIGNLTAIKMFYLGGNPIKRLPDTIGNLKELEYLDLAETQLEELPEALVHLPKLKNIALYRTPNGDEMLAKLRKLAPGAKF